jgi:hypothetical protein
MLRLLVAILPTPLGHALSTRSCPREPGPPPTTRNPDPANEPRHPARGPSLLGPSAPILEPMGRSPSHRRAGHGRALASRRVSHLLGLAIPTRKALRSSSPASGGPSAHPEDGIREPLGRAPHPRRVAVPRLRCLRAQRLPYVRSMPHTPRANPTWTTFLRNHRDGIAAMDLFTVSTTMLRVLHVFLEQEPDPGLNRRWCKRA